MWQQLQQQQKSYKRHSDDDTVFLRLDPTLEAAARRGTRTRRRIILTTLTGLALGLFRVLQLFSWLTAELRGRVYYCQHLTVVAVSSYIPYSAVIDVCGLFNEMKAALKL